MSNKIDYDSFFRSDLSLTPTKQITHRDLISQQAMVYASTDDLATEIEKRLYPDSSAPHTDLESFKTEALVEELSLRAQKMALLIVAAQNAMTMGEAILSIGNLFGGSSLFPADGYSLESNEITGSKDV